MIFASPPMIPYEIATLCLCERSVVRNLPLPCCVLEQDTLLPESTGNIQEAVLRPDMIEKLLNLKTNKQIINNISTDRKDSAQIYSSICRNKLSIAVHPWNNNLLIYRR